MFIIYLRAAAVEKWNDVHAVTGEFVVTEVFRFGETMMWKANIKKIIIISFVLFVPCYGKRNTLKKVKKLFGILISKN